jgi:hypothetical protein
LKYIQKKYDSMGVFPQRTNGFKLTWILAGNKREIFNIACWYWANLGCVASVDFMAL